VKSLLRDFILLVVAVLGVASDARATAAEAVAPAAMGEGQGLDEVVVSIKKLRQLRKDFRAAETRFYNLYNALNRNPNFDLTCEDAAPIGTLIAQRQCRPRFQIRAEEDEAQAFLRGYVAMPATLVVGMHLNEYHKNMRALLRAHPELFQALRDFVNLRRQYDLTRKDRFKDTWIVFE
jgi:hypothetical protein